MTFDNPILIYSAAYLFFCLGTQALFCGISWIMQAARTSIFYRYDSADIIDEEDDTPGQ